MQPDQLPQRTVEYPPGQMIRRKTFGWFRHEVQFSNGTELRFGGGSDSLGHTDAFIRSAPNEPFLPLPHLRQGRRSVISGTSGVEICGPSGDGGSVRQRINADSSMQFEYWEPSSRWVARITIAADGSLPEGCSFDSKESRLSIRQQNGQTLEFQVPIAPSRLRLPEPLSTDLREMQQRLCPVPPGPAATVEFARAQVEPASWPRFEYSNCHRYG